MPVPKRKTSRTRRDMRRAHIHVSAPNLSKCPQCREPRLSHQVCPHCGYYKGKEIIPPEQA